LIIFVLKYEFVYIHVLKKSLFMCLLPKDCESAKSWPCVAQCILYCYVIYWLLRNQDNVSEWSDMYIHGLLFLLAITMKKNKRVGLEKSGHHHHLINLVSPWYSYKIAELALNKQQIPVDNLWFEIWICLYTCTQKVAIYVSSAEGLWKREKLTVRCTMYFVLLRYLLSLFDPIGTRTHDLPHSRRARQRLHYRWDSLVSISGLFLSEYIYCLHKWQ
jgi:hypothetical protein